jgi:hypothetical protein
MAGHRRAAIVADDDEQVDTRGLTRLGAWGLCAFISVAATAIAARTDLGALRISAALGAISAAPGESEPPAAQLLARTAAAERDAFRAIETAQTISADRERLALRLITLERDIGDISGSVQRALAIAAESKATSQFPSMASAALLTHSKNSSPAGWTPPAPSVVSADLAPPPTVVTLVSAERPFDKTAMTGGPPTRTPPAPPPAAAPHAIAAAPPAPPPAPPAAAPPVVPPAATPAKEASPAKPDETSPAVTASVGAADSPLKVDLGADLGPALTMTRLRARWTKLSAEHPEMVKGLRPLVTVRELGPGKPVEIRLVIGPLANVNVATEFCTALIAAQYLCRPAVFDGQRLAVQ